MKRISFRMDDVGASSKQWEIYGTWVIRAGGKKISIPFVPNLLSLKRLSFFKGWGPYRELSEKEWEDILTILRKNHASMTVGITACWVEKDGGLTPFPKKFPAQAAKIKRGLQEGLLEIANHGLTHCVVGKHLPRLFTSNRRYHREFWDWVPKEVHEEHMQKSQNILENYFEEEIITFIPPGNLCTEDTLQYASEYGIQYFSSARQLTKTFGIQYVHPSKVFDFHDREIILQGIPWLEEQLRKYLQEYENICSIRELR